MKALPIVIMSMFLNVSYAQKQIQLKLLFKGKNLTK